jgi:hypothetical protein
MKKRTLWIGAGLSALILTAAGTTWAAGRISCWQADQCRRITAGVRYGWITPGEYDRLSREQGRIRQARRLARADGCLDPRERRYIHRMQQRAGKHIRRARQNRPAGGVCQGLGKRPCCGLGRDLGVSSGRLGLCTPLAGLSTLSMCWSW